MNEDKIQLFEDQPIRTAWVEDEEEWYFSKTDSKRKEVSWLQVVTN